MVWRRARRLPGPAARQSLAGNRCSVEMPRALSHVAVPQPVRCQQSPGTAMVQAEEMKPSLIPLHMVGLDVIAAQSRSAIPLASGRCAGSRDR